MENLTPLLEVGSSLPSPILTTTQEIVNPTISALGANDATSLMTPITTFKRENVKSPSNGITKIPRSLSGGNKKITRQELIRASQGDELMLNLHQMTLDAYKPLMDAMKHYLEIHGSQSPNFYMTKNKQVAAACQMTGINDPDATRKQRIAAMTCYEMLLEAIMTGLENNLGKDRIKEMMNDAINKAAEFFNLGNKKAVKAREKAAKGKGK